VRALAAVALLVVSGWTAGGGESRPALRVVATAPVTVAGTGFAAGERVRLTLRAGRARPSTRTVDAGRDGRFRARFNALLAVEPCSGTLVVTAAGSRGSRASWKRVCRPPSTRPPRVAG
jgi:hypothetical protein